MPRAPRLERPLDRAPYFTAKKRSLRVIIAEQGLRGDHQFLDFTPAFQSGEMPYVELME